MTVALLTILLLAAQAPNSATLPTLLLPAGAGAWVVRIETSGGFTGRGLGNYTASSVGELRCASLSTSVCPDRFGPDTQQTISQLVTAIPLLVSPPSPGAPSRGTNVCYDCVTTTMSVRRRDGDAQRTVTYRWDESTLATIPGEVLRLHAAVVALGAPSPR